MYFFQRIFDTVKDCLFPIFCLGCEKEGTWLCDACLVRVDAGGVFRCPLCHAHSAYGDCCATCRSASALACVVSVTPYRDVWVIGRLIHALKYRSASDCFSACEKILSRFFSVSKDFLQPCDAVIPVPLHPRRFAERGFNQAEMIAEFVSALTHAPLVPALRRIRYTKQQAMLKRAERKKNIRGAFSIAKGYEREVFGKRLLLIDDVFTTGVTMEECAHVLLTAGALSVSGFTLARG